MSGVEQQLASLSPEQRELLALLLEREGIGAPPLSSTQQRLLATTQLAHGTSVGNVPFGFRVSGPLRVPLLLQCLQEIGRRHEVLRTTFQEADGRAVPVVAPALAVNVPIVDLRALPLPERDAEALRLVSAEAQRPLDVASGPLLRGLVVRLADEEWMLELVTHHLVSDGWGIRLLLQELGALYRSALGGTPAPLPELRVQYADYARSERRWLDGAELSAQLAYWRAHLRGLRASELPLDRPRPPRTSWTSATARLELSPELSDGLRRLSREEGVTLYTVLLAAFQTLLQRYSLESDVVVGTTISRRHRTEWEALIGNFGNNLLLRADFSGEPTFHDVLQRVRDDVLGAFAHPDMPLETLIAAAPTDADSGPVPPFQVMFILRDTTLVQNLDLGGLVLRPISIGAGATALDLTLDITDGAAALTGSLEYKVELFDAATIARMVAAYGDLLERIVANPRRPISQLPVLRATGCTQSDPAHVSSQPEAVGTGPLPQTASEIRIAALWRQALGIAAVSVHDNFFDLGGHSLLGTTVIDRIERATGCRLTLVDLGLQNLGQLAQRCDQHTSHTNAASVTRRLLRMVRGAAGRE